MKDNRDPEELGKSILATREHFGCGIIEAADRIEALWMSVAGLNTNGRNSYLATPGVGAPAGTPPSELPGEARR